MKPRQPSRRPRRETVAIPTGSKTKAWEMRRVGFVSVASRRSTPGGGGPEQMPAEALKCKECQEQPTRSKRATCVSAASARSRSPTTRGVRRSRGARAPDPGRPAPIWRYSDFLPLERHAARRAAHRLHAAGARRPPRRAARPRRGLGQERHRATPRTRSRTASSRSRSPRRSSSASRRSRARPPATSPTRSRRTPPPPACASYVFIPSDLEQDKILATGVYGGPRRRRRRQLRRREPPLHRALRRARAGRSSTSTCGRTTPRAPRRSRSRPPSSSAGELPDHVVVPIASGSLFTKIARASRSGSTSGLLDGDACRR